MIENRRNRRLFVERHPNEKQIDGSSHHQLTLLGVAVNAQKKRRWIKFSRRFPVMSCRTIKIAVRRGRLVHR